VHKTHDFKVKFEILKRVEIGEAQAVTARYVPMPFVRLSRFI